jgi:uncharacterized membrane protein YfcA
VREVLAYVAGALTGLWGVFHVVPTSRVIAWLQPANRYSRLVMTQEWVAEAVSMWGVAALVVTVTATSASHSQADWVYRVSAMVLAALAALTAATGARAPSVWFKICLPVLATSAALLVAASLTS